MIRNQQGIALFQILVMITILVGIFGLILAKQVRLQGKLSTSITLMQFEQIEQSAERIVLDLLNQDRISIAQTGEGFEWPYEMEEPLENILGAEVTIFIEPLDGKLNLNLLYQQHFNQNNNPPSFNAIEMIANSAVIGSDTSFNVLDENISANNYDDQDQGGISSIDELKEILTEASNFIQNSATVGVNFDYEEPRYLKSGLPFADISEVLLTSDREIEQRQAFNTMVYNQFALLPINSKLNINLANDATLKSLHSGIVDNIVNDITTIQSGAGFQSVDDFLNLPALQPFKSEIPAELLTHYSEYFVATILVSLPTDNEQGPISRWRDIFIHRPEDQTKPVQIYQRKFVPL